MICIRLHHWKYFQLDHFIYSFYHLFITTKPLVEYIFLVSCKSFILLEETKEKNVWQAAAQESCNISTTMHRCAFSHCLKSVEFALTTY